MNSAIVRRQENDAELVQAILGDTRPRAEAGFVNIMLTEFGR